MIMSIKTNEETFEVDVLNSEKPVVVDFYADWCGPCRALAPTLDTISDENSDVVVAKVNIEENNDLANKYGVRSLPTLVFFKDGKPAGILVGLQSKDTILSKLEELK